MQGKVSGLQLVNFSAVIPKRNAKMRNITVQKSVTKEEPIEFDVENGSANFLKKKTNMVGEI